MYETKITFQNEDDFTNAVVKALNVVGVTVTADRDDLTLIISAENDNIQAGAAMFVEELDETCKIRAFTTAIEGRNYVELLLQHSNTLLELGDATKAKEQAEKDADLYKSLWVSCNKETDRCKSILGLIREQLNLLYPKN